MSFKQDKPYFVYDPDGDGIIYFATIEERDKYAEECIQSYLNSDGWMDEVANLVAGVVTHSAQKTDIENRPDILDEEGCDEYGNYWGDWLSRCNYKLLPIEPKKEDKT